MPLMSDQVPKGARLARGVRWGTRAMSFDGARTLWVHTRSGKVVAELRVDREFADEEFKLMIQEWLDRRVDPVVVEATAYTPLKLA